MSCALNLVLYIVALFMFCQKCQASLIEEHDVSSNKTGVHTFCSMHALLKFIFRVIC